MAQLLIAAVALIQLGLPAARRNLETARSDSAPNFLAPNETATANDNRHSAGVFRDGVLVIRLEAKPAQWRPGSSKGSLLPMFAFAEEGNLASVPGPLIRMREGTDVRVFVSNNAGKPLLMRGLQQRPGKTDSVDIPPGENHEFHFRAGTPGTYYYYGRTAGDRLGFGEVEDSQLAGAIVVDPSDSPPRADRTFVITSWYDEGDTTAVPRSRVAEYFFVNGKSWPYTERIQATVGDSLRWRLIDASGAPHPMHLHGFFYEILERGSETADTVYQSGAIRTVVTELLLPGTTELVTWSAERAGNWLFHCHFNSHVSHDRSVETDGPEENEMHASGSHANHAAVGMAGLILGIQVRPNSERDVRAPFVPARKLSLFVDERANVFGSHPAYGFVLQHGAIPALDSAPPSGTPIVLTKGEATEINVINRTQQPVEVHWHGIELESYYDGVGGWSGLGARVAPPIEPGRSFIVRITPRRAGTFIYHTHDDERGQLASGLYGPLIIVNPGQVRDTATDRIFLMASSGPGAGAPAALNGSREPAPLQLAAGKTYRFRFINISPNTGKVVALLGSDGNPVKWRTLAKDGADLPPQQVAEVPAMLPEVSGETYDFTFQPEQPGTLTLQIITYEFPFKPRLMRVPVIVGQKTRGLSDTVSSR